MSQVTVTVQGENSLTLQLNQAPSLSITLAPTNLTVTEDSKTVQVNNTENKIEVTTQPQNVTVHGNFVPGPKGDKGDPGDPGTSGVNLISVPVTIGLAQLNDWVNVPHSFTTVAEVETFDNLNEQKIEIDCRILTDQTVQIKSKKQTTYTVRIIGV